MTPKADVRLCELLTARLCHELVGPITAVASGVDLLGEPGAEPDLEAMALLGESAQRASRRLQFYRFAYGFAEGSQIAGAPPWELAAGHFADPRLTCRYSAAARALPLIEQKLGCNLLAFGAEVLSRGGELALEVVRSELRLEAAGEIASPSREQLAALTLSASLAALTPRTVHGYAAALP
jgi:histidine phosphotransferase ChpT